MLPLRCYNLVYNEWFRDQNIIDSVYTDDDDTDTGAPATNYSLQKRGKRHDYFTSCLVNPQKDPTSAQSLPLGTTAEVRFEGTAGQDIGIKSSSGGVGVALQTGTAVNLHWNNAAPVEGNYIYTDLSSATAATILQLRQAMQIQALIELDARAGTRYNEIVYATFGVTPP